MFKLNDLKGVLYEYKLIKIIIWIFFVGLQEQKMEVNIQ